MHVVGTVHRCVTACFSFLHVFRGGQASHLPSTCVRNMITEESRCRGLTSYASNPFLMSLLLKSACPRTPPCVSIYLAPSLSRLKLTCVALSQSRAVLRRRLPLRKHGTVRGQVHRKKSRHRDGERAAEHQAGGQVFRGRDGHRGKQGAWV